MLEYCTVFSGRTSKLKKLVQDPTYIGICTKRPG
jgi:hypothetical protein